MTVRWLTAFIDLPASTYEAGVRFWSDITGTTVSAPRGDTGQFATLVPADGDAHIRVQRIDDGPGRIHLDLHVDDTASAIDAAVRAGAVIIDQNDVTTLQSPGGFVFCIVDHHGEQTTPSPIAHGTIPTRMNQVCIDIPSTHFESERRFWSAVTGWPLRPDNGTEFGALITPPTMPFRLLLQRLGDDDGDERVRAHLDIGAGSSWPDAVEHQERSGATRLSTGQHWSVFQDPSGGVYCVTGRDPDV